MGPRLLLLQLGAVAAASCLCLLAARFPLDAAPRAPPLASRGVPAGTAAVAPAPAAGVPRAPVVDVDDDGTGVPTAAAVFVSRGARRLGLSDIVAADAPAATSDDDDDAAAPAAASPSGAHAAAGSTSLLAIFSPVLFILGCGLFVAGLLKSADLCAAAKARRHNARRVRPLCQDAVEAAAGP